MPRTLPLAAITLAIAANAHATSFTTEADFLAAAPDALLETFDDLQGQDTPNVPGDVLAELESLGITFTDPGEGLPGVVDYDISQGASPRSVPNALLNRSTIEVLSTQGWFFSATDGSLIRSVGLWNIGTDDGMTLRFFDANDNVIESFTIGPIDQDGQRPNFGAIVSEVGAARIALEWNGQGNGLMGIDDLWVELAPSLGFTVAGIDARAGVCRNLTDPQSVVLPSPQVALDSAFTCADGGAFSTAPGDEVLLIALGTNFGPGLAGTVTGASDGVAGCINQSTGQAVNVAVDDAGTWDCEAAGLALALQDRVLVVLSGSAM